MQAILHFFANFRPWSIRKLRERKQLERRVAVGTERAIKEYRATFEKLKEYDKR